MQPVIYHRRFYEVDLAVAESAAEVIVPMILSVFPAKSVVDVGCGTGAWLKVFERHGVHDYLGLDSTFLPRDLRLIPPERFRAVDLGVLSRLDRRFDLACSLEVAEHLPKQRAAMFVELLTSAAPVVLFSAAIPHQGGTGHVNEQWQCYWAELFAARGYAAYDLIRPTVYHDERVAWFYRQNTLLYCAEDHRPTQYNLVSHPAQLNLVHPLMVEALVHCGVKRQARRLWENALVSARRRLRSS